MWNKFVCIWYKVFPPDGKTIGAKCNPYCRGLGQQTGTWSSWWRPAWAEGRWCDAELTADRHKTRKTLWRKSSSAPNVISLLLSIRSSWTSFINKCGKTSRTQTSQKRSASSFTDRLLGRKRKPLDTQTRIKRVKTSMLGGTKDLHVWRASAASHCCWDCSREPFIILTLSPEAACGDAGSAQTGRATYCCHDTGSVKRSSKHQWHNNKRQRLLRTLCRALLKWETLCLTLSYSRRKREDDVALSICEECVWESVFLHIHGEPSPAAAGFNLPGGGNYFT